jgi:hypothetical protein
MCCCITLLDPDIWVTIITVVGTLSSALIISWRNEKKQKKLDSVAALYLFRVFYHEVDKGCQTLTKAYTWALSKDENNRFPRRKLPTSGWIGMKNINPRIIARVSSLDASAVKSAKKSGVGFYEGFEPDTLFKHLNNYFEYMCLNYNTRIDNFEPSGLVNKQNLAKAFDEGEDFEAYHEAASKVRRLLSLMIKELEKDSKKSILRVRR